jgi:hypothetical protein
MSDHRWDKVIAPDQREALMKGKLPRITFGSKPDLAPGDRIVLDYGKTGDPELRTTIRYARRWIGVVKVSREDGRHRLDYSPPHKATLYLRAGTGYTTDRLRSIDREVEAERVTVTPEQRQENTLQAERRRIEDNLRHHLARFHGTDNERTRRILAPVIRSCRDKLEALDR